MDYEYLVKTEGGSTFDNLERAGARLQSMLNSSETVTRSKMGWELWQVNTLAEKQGINGLLLIYRRPRR